jgi:hypothetical protein
MVSCVPEKKVASEYLSKRKDILIVIKAPEWVKMVNQIPDSIDSVSYLTQLQKDSVKLIKAKILPHVSDSSLIQNYVLSMKRGFDLMGYKTYIANKNDTVFPVKGNAIFVNIGQIELDEGVYPVRDEIKYHNHLYTADFDLTKIGLCFWLELNRLEDGVPTKTPRVFYTSFEKMNEFDGHFDLDEVSNLMRYYSTTLDITPDYVNGSMIKLGYNHALGLNTMLMNEYIGYKLPNKPDRWLLSLDSEYGVLYRIDALPFEELK